VRIRKQSRPSEAPGDSFLRAVSSGRSNRLAPSAAAPSERADPGSGQELLEARRRAESAEESLRQIRLESKVRLEEARQALAAERSARLAAEKQLAQARRGPRSAPVAQAPEAEPEAPDEQPVAPRVEEHHAPKPGDADAARLRDSPPHAAGDPDGEWPTPWLERQ
jgi:hypothetical protein